MEEMEGMPPTGSSQKKGKLVKEAEEYKEKLEKRGVIYISRVPPFMKPNKARNMFEQYGEVTRLYLAEEGLIGLNSLFSLDYFQFIQKFFVDIMQRRRRKESGGNGSKQFSEGKLCN